MNNPYDLIGRRIEIDKEVFSDKLGRPAIINYYFAPQPLPQFGTEDHWNAKLDDGRNMILPRGFFRLISDHE